MLSEELSTEVTIAYGIEEHENGYDPAEPSDYSTPSGMVTIEAGETTAAIAIFINEDDEAEPTREAFRVVLEAPPAGAFYTLAADSERTSAVVVINEGVCDRTVSVRRAIVNAVGNAADCSEIDDEALGGLERSLEVTIVERADDSPKQGDFSGLVNLQSLQVSRSGGGIFTSSARMFEGLDSLEELTLADLEISGFAQGTFTGLSSLTNLDLTANAFTALTNNVFSDAGLGSTLTQLHLGEFGSGPSELESVQAGAFSGLSGLEALELASAVNLQTLEAGAFSGLGSLRELDLARFG